MERDVFLLLVDGYFGVKALFELVAAWNLWSQNPCAERSTHRLCVAPRQRSMESKRFELGPGPAAYFVLTAFREKVVPLGRCIPARRWWMCMTRTTCSRDWSW